MKPITRPAGNEPPYLLLVTPRQFGQGWRERDGSRQRAFDRIRTDENGNIVVVNPEWQRWASGNRARPNG